MRCGVSRASLKLATVCNREQCRCVYVCTAVATSCSSRQRCLTSLAVLWPSSPVNNWGREEPKP